MLVHTYVTRPGDPERELLGQETLSHDNPLDRPLLSLLGETGVRVTIDHDDGSSLIYERERS